MKSAKKILCLVLTAAMLLSMTACGALGKNPEGYYVLTEKQNNEEQAPFLLFQRNGTVIIFNGTQLLMASWKEGTLQMEGSGAMSYSLDKDDLTLQTGDRTLQFRKTKDNAPDLEELQKELDRRREEQAQQQKEEEKEQQRLKAAGCYILEGETAGSLIDQPPFLLLREDRTAVLFDGKALTEGTWELGQLSLGNQEPMDFALEEDRLYLYTREGELQYGKSGGPAPEPAEVQQKLEEEQQHRQATGAYVTEDETAYSESDQLPFLLLQEDGTAVLFDGEILANGSWDAGQLSLENFGPMEYTVKENTLTLDTGDGILELQRTEKAPDLQKVENDLAAPEEQGFYELKELNEHGETMTEEEYGAEWYLALYGDGTGALCIVEHEYGEVSWEDGILCDTEEPDTKVSFTLDRGELKININGLEATCVRIAKNPPDRETLQEMAAIPEVGYFVLTSLETGETSVTGDELKEEMKLLPFVLLREDGTGAVYSGQGLSYVCWEDGAIWEEYVPDEKTVYEVEGDILTLRDGETTAVLQRSYKVSPDLDRVAANGPDLTGEYALYSYNQGYGDSYDREASMSLQEDGTGTFHYPGGSFNVDWDQNGITVDYTSFYYQLNDDGSLHLQGYEGSYEFRLISHGAEDMKFWAGDWYGWWVMKDCTGDMADQEGSWWDMCGRSTVSADGEGSFVLWDEDSGSMDNPRADLRFLVENATEDFRGRFRSTKGKMNGQRLGMGDWSCNPDESPYENMIIFSGNRDTGTGSCSYVIYLRPWGTRWEDADEFYMPFHYTDWYLPLIEAEQPMPEIMEIK